MVMTVTVVEEVTVVVMIERGNIVDVNMHIALPVLHSSLKAYKPFHMEILGSKHISSCGLSLCVCEKEKEKRVLEIYKGDERKEDHFYSDLLLHECV